MSTLLGYAYDSHLSYLDHLRIEDAAREAADRGAQRVEAGIADGASHVAGAVGELSSEVQTARELMEWGFSAILDEVEEMRVTLQALLKCVRNPSQTWAYEQFDIARSNFLKGNYEDCLKRLDYATDGYQTHLGYPEGWQFHLLKADVYMQCPDRSLIDPPKAEKSFLAAAKYADTAQIRAKALTGSAVAAYVQGHMEDAEKHAEQACDMEPAFAEPWFQLARIRLNRRDSDGAWQAARKAIALDHRYAARIPLDSEFRRNVALVKPAWAKYGKELRTQLEAAARSAAAMMRELEKSREDTSRLRNSPAFNFFDLAGQGLAPAKARFHEMIERVDTLSPDAETELALLTATLQENTVYAFLEAGPHAQKACDSVCRALAASREAELTLRKVTELSRSAPGTFPLLRTLSESGGCIFVMALWSSFWVYGAVAAVNQSTDSKNREHTIAGAVGVLLVFVALPIVLGVVGLYLRCKEKAFEVFDWSPANRPQTADYASPSGAQPSGGAIHTGVMPAGQ